MEENKEKPERPDAYYTIKDFLEVIENMKYDHEDLKSGETSPLEVFLRLIAYASDYLRNNSDSKYFSDIYMDSMYNREEDRPYEETFNERVASAISSLFNEFENLFYYILGTTRLLQIGSIFPLIELINNQNEQLNQLRNQIKELTAKFRYAGYSSYQEYLQSPHWQETRKRALERAGNHCSVCRNTQNLNVHHNNYDRIGKELDTDLIVLCEKCHTLFYKEGKLSSPE